MIRLKKITTINEHFSLRVLSSLLSKLQCILYHLDLGVSCFISIFFVISVSSFFGTKQLYHNSFGSFIHIDLKIIQRWKNEAHIGYGYILTCAHCVVHDDVDDDDPAKNKVGRIVELVTARGKAFGAICVMACDKTDLALLHIPSSSSSYDDCSITRLELGCLKVGPKGSDSNGTKIFAIGNPCDTDLETKVKNKSTGFFPFHVSEGNLVTKVSEEIARKDGLGRQIHNAWTYWGHSGCPLVTTIDNFGPCIVGLHNSWDDRNGNRHGITLDEISLFVRGASVELPSCYRLKCEHNCDEILEGCSTKRSSYFLRPRN